MVLMTYLKLYLQKLMGLPPDEQHTYWAAIKRDKTFAGKVYMALDQDTKTHLKTIKETA